MLKAKSTRIILNTINMEGILLELIPYRNKDKDVSIIDRYDNIEDATDKARELLKEDKTFSMVMIWNSHECMRVIKQK